jgi:uncharacterized protein with GYD domain
MQLFYTAGKYDFVMTVEIPKDDDLMATLLCTCSMGNTRTVTMKAWIEADGAKMLTRLIHKSSTSALRPPLHFFQFC